MRPDRRSRFSFFSAQPPWAKIIPTLSSQNHEINPAGSAPCSLLDSLSPRCSLPNTSLGQLANAVPSRQIALRVLHFGLSESAEWGAWKLETKLRVTFAHWPLSTYLKSGLIWPEGPQHTPWWAGPNKSPIDTSAGASNGRIQPAFFAFEIKKKPTESRLKIKWCLFFWLSRALASHRLEDSSFHLKWYLSR